ncbi:MAG TPA: hypothetical protein VJ751_13055 [Pyrinomonadaceae bacterium]|nr:hypothetical protein [Pyrinomonadaceae bacterium]
MIDSKLSSGTRNGYNFTIELTTDEMNVEGLLLSVFLKLIATAAYDRSMSMKVLLFVPAITTADLQQRWMSHLI